MCENQEQNISFDKRHGRLLAMLQELASIDSRDEGALYNKICQQARELVAANHCHIRMADWAKEELEIKGHDSKEKYKIDFKQFLSIKFGETIGGRVFRSGISEIVTNVQIDRDFKDYFKNATNKEFVEFLKSIKSSIVVPLFLGKKIIGVLSVLRLESEIDKQSSKPFENNDKIIIEMFAENISLAVHNAWLCNAAIWKLEEDQEKGEGIKIGEFCEKIIKKRVKQKMEIDSGQIRFYSWDEKYLVPGTIQWVGSFTLDVCQLCNLKSSECPQCRAIKERKPQIVHDFQTDEIVFITKLERQKKIYQILLSKLKDCLDHINENENENEIKSFINEKLQEIRDAGYKSDNIESRFNLLLKNLINGDFNRDKIKKILQDQITFLENLSNEWPKYVNDIKEIKSEVAVPIFHGSNILGVLAVHSYKQNGFTNIDVIILQSLANCVADEVMEYQQRILKNLLAIGQEMATKWEYKVVAETIAKGIKEAIAFYRSTDGVEEIYPLLYLCHPLPPQKLVKEDFGKHFTYEPRTNATVPEKELGEVHVSNTGLGYEAVNKYQQESKPVFIVRPNVDDPVNGGSEEARNKGIKSTACLPLVFKDKVYGLLYIHSKKRLFFTKLEKEALILFASQIAIVLKNVPELKEAREARNERDINTYSDTYGNELLNKASLYSEKHTSEELGLYWKISDILHKNAVTGKTLGRAITPLKEIANKLVNESKLPNFIAERYSTYQEEEDALLYSDATYRDHFFHPFHTFLLGFSVLTELKKIKIKNPAMSVPLNTDESFLKKWLLVSLWHDITYTAERVPHWLSEYIKKNLGFDVSITADCSKILTKNENISFIENIAKIFEPEEKRITFKTWLFKQLIDWRDHAVLSAILLLKDFFKKDKEGNFVNRVNCELTDAEIYECAFSIAIHNFPKAILNDGEKILKEIIKEEDSPAKQIGSLDIEKYQLAFLLSYCDTMQEWGRPTVREYTDHIKFSDIKAEESQYKILTVLSFDIKKYIGKEQNNKKEQKEAVNKLEEWGNNKASALAEAWKYKGWWKFILTQEFLYNQDVEGIKNHPCCKNE